MARLRKGEKGSKETKVKRSLHHHFFGVKESELADELGWDRRTVNNYLRKLEREGEAYKEKWLWFKDK